jgi:hypothetical protein
MQLGNLPQRSKDMCTLPLQGYDSIQRLVTLKMNGTYSSATSESNYQSHVTTTQKTCCQKKERERQRFASKNCFRIVTYPVGKV